MQRRILISADDYEIRICVVENSKLAEFVLERRGEERTVGNIYKGIVTSIIPGMEAAFVDVGLSRNAFLYVDDVISDHHYDFIDGEDLEDDVAPPAKDLPPVTIQDLLKDQQEIMVQLHKEPIGVKASRVTTNISLPGRYLVLLPCTNHVGVSRKIEDETQRERLIDTVSSLVPEGMGAIVRTAAMECSEDDFRTDLHFLVEEWNKIKKRADAISAPAEVYHNPSTVFQFIRDMISDDMEEIVIDEPSLYSEVMEYLKEIDQSLSYRVTYYDESTPIFYAYGMDTEIQKLRSKKVWLQSGGYIIIEETEAMTVIDVNTGRYLGKHNLEETVYKTNIEAATEIALQLRLRDIGGIIIIDFIDMQEPDHRFQLIEHFSGLVKEDRSRCNIYPLTDLGLLQMTRKRVRKSLNRMITQPCPYCKRDGSILSTDTMMINTFRTFEEICKEDSVEKVTLRIHPRVAKKIQEEKKREVERLQAKYGVQLEVLPGDDLHFEQIIEEIQ